MIKPQPGPDTWASLQTPFQNDALNAINNIPDGTIPDVPMSSAYAAAIYKLYRAGIVQGVDEITRAADPESNIRRSEVAAILTRMMDTGARIRFDTGSSDFRITAQPASAKGARGSQVSFSVAAEGGTVPYSYEWQLRSSQGDWKPAGSALNGKSTITLTLGDWIDGDSWFIRCVIKDAYGRTATSSAASITLTVCTPLKIRSQPKDAAAKNGEYVSFKVEVKAAREYINTMAEVRFPYSRSVAERRKRLKYIRLLCRSKGL